MIVSYKQLARLLALLTFLTSAGYSIAQDERWFRIELLIFSHDSENAGSTEQWNPTPDLAYPGEARFLVDPEYIASNLALFNASSTIDERGRQTLVIIPPPEEIDEASDTLNELPGENDPEPGSELLNDLPSPTYDPNATEAAADANEPLSDEMVAKLPSPFVLLAHSEQELRGKAAYMQRTGRYQILFHETWLQPMADQANAIPVIIDRSGDDEMWPRLQGSIKLYLSRYLHFETNLWLNTSGAYLPSEWQMPAPPLGPRSLTVIYPPEPESDPNAPVDPNEEILLALEPVPDLPEGVESEELEPEGPLYPWRHAVTLKQERRMRSTEVHYIDHPMLGIVVKMSPLSEEELSIRAAAELPELQADPVSQD